MVALGPEGGSVKIDPSCPREQFISIGTAGGKGTICTVFLSKASVLPELRAEPPVKLNGYCQYAFLYGGSSICGFLVLSPVGLTDVSPSHLAVGKCEDPTEAFESRDTLRPQGVMLLESSGSSVIFASMRVRSPLLIKVD